MEIVLKPSNNRTIAKLLSIYNYMRKPANSRDIMLYSMVDKLHYWMIRITDSPVLIEEIHLCSLN